MTRDYAVRIVDLVGNPSLVHGIYELKVAEAEKIIREAEDAARQDMRDSYAPAAEVWDKQLAEAKKQGAEAKRKEIRRAVEVKVDPYEGSGVTVKAAVLGLSELQPPSPEVPEVIEAMVDRLFNEDGDIRKLSRSQCRDELHREWLKQEGK